VAVLHHAGSDVLTRADEARVLATAERAIATMSLRWTCGWNPVPVWVHRGAKPTVGCGRISSWMMELIGAVYSSVECLRLQSQYSICWAMTPLQLPGVRRLAEQALVLRGDPTRSASATQVVRDSSRIRPLERGDCLQPVADPQAAQFGQDPSYRWGQERCSRSPGARCGSPQAPGTIAPGLPRWLSDEPDDVRGQLQWRPQSAHIGLRC